MTRRKWTPPRSSRACRRRRRLRRRFEPNSRSSKYLLAFEEQRRGVGEGTTGGSWSASRSSSRPTWIRRGTYEAGKRRRRGDGPAAAVRPAAGPRRRGGAGRGGGAAGRRRRVSDGGRPGACGSFASSSRGGPDAASKARGERDGAGVQAVPTERRSCTRKGVRPDARRAPMRALLSVLEPTPAAWTLAAASRAPATGSPRGRIRGKEGQGQGRVDVRLNSASPILDPDRRLAAEESVKLIMLLGQVRRGGAIGRDMLIRRVFPERTASSSPHCHPAGRAGRPGEYTRVLQGRTDRQRDRRTHADARSVSGEREQPTSVGAHARVPAAGNSAARCTTSASALRLCTPRAAARGRRARPRGPGLTRTATLGRELSRRRSPREGPGGGRVWRRRLDSRGVRVDPRDGHGVAARAVVVLANTRAWRICASRAPWTSYRRGGSDQSVRDGRLGATTSAVTLLLQAPGEGVGALVRAGRFGGWRKRRTSPSPPR